MQPDLQQTVRQAALLLAALAVLALGLAVGGGADAMELSSVRRTIPGFLPQQSTNLLTLKLTGPVVEGDAAKVRKAFRPEQEEAERDKRLLVATVELSSLGGDVREAMALGYLFRELRLPTVVRSTDSCLSACAFAFLGGTAIRDGLIEPARSIEIGGQVGFHNIAMNYAALLATRANAPAAVAANEAFELSRGGAALVIRFLTDMAIDSELGVQILGRPASEFVRIVTAEEFLALQTCLVGATPPRLPPAEQATNICANAAGLHGQVDLSRAQPVEGRRLRELLLQRLKGIARSSRLTEHLTLVATTKDSQLVAETYESLRAVGAPLLDVFGSTFQVDGLPIGGQRVSCFVSVSSGPEDRYDVLFSEPGIVPHRAPPACRWLMRRPADEILNPAQK